jgi:hypothetical protein
MSTITADDESGAATHAPERPIQVLDNTMCIHDLRIDRASIVAYLQNIPADKQEIALVHALEVGVTELAARRERFRQH